MTLHLLVIVIRIKFLALLVCLLPVSCSTLALGALLFILRLEELSDKEHTERTAGADLGESGLPLFMA